MTVNNMKGSILKQFKGRKLVIATMHKKEKVIAPLLEKYLGVRIIIPKNLNTNQFGTFTREIERTGDQLEAARKKAYAAMDSENVDLGISSEGSFSAHPFIPFVQSNLELVLFIDKKNNYEIKGHYRTSKTNISGQYVSNIEEALDFARKIGFPECGIIVRKSENGKNGIYKDIYTKEDFVKKVAEMFSRPFVKRIFLETDMRAHRNPMRMEAIKKATKDLIKNITSLCPKCQTPGFIIIDFEKGLKCSLCNLSTDLPLNDIYQCSVCHYKEKKAVTKYGKTADPRYCGHCNP